MKYTHKSQSEEDISEMQETQFQAYTAIQRFVFPSKNFFLKKLGDIRPFCRATDTPVFDFWWCLSGFQRQTGQPYLCLAEAYVLHVLNVEVVSNETNTDVRMYNLFIRWSALLGVQVGTEILKEISLVFYTIATKEENMWELLLGDNWHWHINRITIARETVTWVN